MTLDAVGRELFDFFEHCIAAGLTLPFIVCLANRHGFANVMRVSDNNLKFLAELDNVVAQLPIHGLLLERGGQTVLFGIDEAGLRYEAFALLDKNRTDKSKS